MSDLDVKRSQLVDAARADTPTTADRERIRVAIAARLAAPGSHHPPGREAAGAKGSGALGLGSLGVATAIVVGICAAVVWTRRGGDEHPLRDVAPATTAPPALGSTSEIGDPGSVSTASASTPAATPTAPVDPTASATKPASPPRSASALAPRVPKAPNGGLAEEVEMLREARDATRAGDAQRAIAVLDELDRRQPVGALGEERRASRIVAQCDSKAPGAVGEGARFLREMPSSIHAERVRAACEKKKVAP